MVLNGRNMLLNYAAILLSCLMCGAQEQLELHIYSFDKNVLTQAARGEPFLLEVSLRGASGDLSKPEIAVPKECIARYSGFNMMSVNNTSNLISTFTARIDKPGTYSLGPATVRHNGKLLQSNRVTITVGDRAETQAPPTENKGRQKNTQEPAFARLMVNAEKAVVGEKLLGTLRFYQTKKGTDLKEIGEPDFAQAGFVVKNRVGPSQSRELIDGVWYDYLQWQWELYPQKMGELTLPAYRIEYLQPEEVMNNWFALFSMISNTQTIKTVYSNAVTIRVDNVPPSKEPINAIGTFKSFSASLKPNLVHEGEAMSLVLELEGDADLDQLILEPKNIPDAVKVYHSKKSSSAISLGVHRFSFEYILQARKKGDYEIPAQSFSYFDVKSRKYETVHTLPLSFTVTPGVVAKIPAVNAAGATQVADQDNTEMVAEIRPLQSSDDLSGKPWHLSWTLFWLLMSAPVCLALIRGLPGTMNHFIFKNRLVRRWRATSWARKEIKHAQKTNNQARLYDLFIEYFNALADSKNNDLTAFSDWMRTHCDPHQFAQWQQFSQAIMQARFFTYDYKNFSSTLFQQAYHWVSYVASRMDT